MVGRGHIAEVLVLEERLGLGPAQLKHHDHTGIGNRHDNTHHGNRAGNRTRVLTASVGLVGPFLLFAQNRRHALFARDGKLRHPVAGEGDACLGEFALMHAGNGIGDHGLVRIE